MKLVKVPVVEVKYPDACACCAGRSSTTIEIRKEDLASLAKAGLLAAAGSSDAGLARQNRVVKVPHCDACSRHVRWTRSGGPNQRGTFVCFHASGVNLPELEIVPRLWNKGPEGVKALTGSSPSRIEIRFEDPAFDAEYRVETRDEPAARQVVSGALRRLLTERGQTGWRLEMSGEWLAVTRLAPAKHIGGMTEPMTPERLEGDERKSYAEHPIGSEHIPRLVEAARRLHEEVVVARR